MDTKKYKVITISDFVNYPPHIRDLGTADSIDDAKTLIDDSNNIQHLIIEFENDYSNGWVVYVQPKK